MIKAKAICFPMLVHEIVKGLYEIVGTEGFGADKEKNQAKLNLKRNSHNWILNPLTPLMEGNH